MERLVCRNLAEAHRRAAERLGPRAALRFKKHGLYHDVSWDCYREAAIACAAALIDAGIATGDRVGLLAENRLEWLATDVGILVAGAVNVPPHAPLTGKQVAFQLAETAARWLFVSTRDQLDKVLAVLDELPALTGIVTFDEPGDPLSSTRVGLDGLKIRPTTRVEDPHAEREAYHSTRVPIVSWTRFLQRGRQARAMAEIDRREARIAPDDLATIMYTSGTTGIPKGVMLTHRNLLSNACAIREIAPHGPDDVALSWLPYSHIYARTVDHYVNLVGGLTTCLAESAETVVENLADVRPTHLSAVPRFYEKVLAAVAATDPAETGRRLRKVFGPRTAWLMSGGAPLPGAVARAYHDAGLVLLQGYGLTETAPVITCNHKDRFKIDTVGLPLPDVDVRIGPDAEVLTRGPHVMKGYWNNPSATAEAIHDGWFHTGDLGSIDADGFLTITGRKKDLLVLSNGKKVVPTFIEGLLAADDCIDQAVVYGEGRNFLTALVVPRWDNLRRALGDTSEATDAVDRLASSPQVRALLAARIDRALVDVANWEKVRKFLIVPQPFSVANDELTVSLKLRRNVVFGKYQQRLDQLYEGDAWE